MIFPSQIFFNDINHGFRAAILKKNYLWLLHYMWLWLLSSVMKRCAERSALQLYQNSLISPYHKNNNYDANLYENICMQHVICTIVNQSVD